ncbi:OmpA family protein [Arhodomonas sp. SL1]|uniref:OmpA family protein n=1 Tax=Arhodomonas sp. SL1 TaxID=3425691 RepID=UPI003F88070A
MGVHIPAKALRRACVAGVTALAVSGCAQTDYFKRHEAEAPVVNGPPVTENTTPLYNAFRCMNGRLKGSYGEEEAPPRVAVGNVKDYTGKFSEMDGGNPITQGGALMVISALGKLGDAVRLHERFDTQIAEMELRYLENRYLGDGEPHLVQDNGEGQRRVPWKPYYGGSIMQTDYYIVGGITELNYNIQSGGAELTVDGAGPQARTFTVNVAADLRVIDTQSLEVIKTTSLQKQITGFEVGLDVFRFFGDTLIDLNAGMKNQEPLQLGVRTTLELGVLELMGAVAGVDERPCVSFDEITPAEREAESEPAEREAAAEQPALPEGATYTVYFDSGSAELNADAQATLDEAAQAARAGEEANLRVEGHTDRAGGEAFNLELSRERAQAVREGLVERGIANDRILLVWYGETRPAVETEDGVAEAENRRAVIRVIPPEGEEA